MNDDLKKKDKLETSRKPLRLRAERIKALAVSTNVRAGRTCLRSCGPMSSF